MDAIKSAILGLVQGLTEFLPVSSSGHLALVENLVPGFGEADVPMNVLLHLGTAFAVCIYVRGEIARMVLALLATFKLRKMDETEARSGRALIIALIAGTIPTGLMGFLLKDFFEALFSSVTSVGMALIATALILVLSDSAGGSKRDDDEEGRAFEAPGILAAFIIGVAQGVAIVPGISRSGTTLTVGILLGLKPADSVKFSFLLSIPAILGAVVLEVFGGDAQMDHGALYYVSGPLVAFIAGYLTLGFLVKLARARRLKLFSGYCAALGLVAIVLGLRQGA